MKLVSALLAISLTAGTLFAGQTWIVDDGGGPGVHFTDIPPAIAAAAPGDTILVLDGTYSGFTLSKGLSIVAQGVARLGHQAGIDVTNVPTGYPAVIAGIQRTHGHPGPAPSTISNCTGTVVMDDVGAMFLLQVSSSRDVRFHAMSNYLVDLEVSDSRVEVVRSTLQGHWGHIGCNGSGGNGGHGITLNAGARAHLSLTSAEGGPGGNCDEWCACSGGDGGHGIAAFAGSQVILSGAGSVHAYGGDGGEPWSGGWGIDGYGMYLEGTAWRSGITILGIGLATGGSIQPMSPWDPTLEYSGIPAPGSTLTVTMTARDGAGVFIYHGNPVVQVDASTHVEMLATASRRNVVHLGAVAGGNQVSVPWTVPASAQPGDLFVMQGVMALQSGKIRRTNSLPIVLR